MTDARLEHHVRMNHHVVAQNDPRPNHGELSNGYVFPYVARLDNRVGANHHSPFLFLDTLSLW